MGIIEISGHIVLKVKEDGGDYWEGSGSLLLFWALKCVRFELIRFGAYHISCLERQSLFMLWLLHQLLMKSIQGTEWEWRLFSGHIALNYWKHTFSGMYISCM